MRTVGVFMNRGLSIKGMRVASLDAFLRRMEGVAALVRIRRRYNRMCGCAYQEPVQPCFVNALVPAARLVARVRDTGCDGSFPIADPRAYVQKALIRLAAILGLAHARVIVRDRPGLERLLSAITDPDSFAETAMISSVQQWFLEACETALAAASGPIPEVLACFSLDQDTREVRDYAFLNRIVALNLEYGFMIMGCEEALPLLMRGPVPAVLSCMPASCNTPHSMDCLNPKHGTRASMRALIVETLGNSSFCFTVRPRKEV